MEHGVDHLFDVALVGRHGHVGDRLVQVGPERGQALELGLCGTPLEQGTIVAAADPRRQSFSSGLQPHHEPGGAQPGAVRGVEDRASAAGDHDRIGRGARIGHSTTFEVAERTLTVGREDLRH